MASFYQDVGDKAENTPINPKDFAKYHIFRISENDKMYAYKAKTKHNERYRLFEEKILNNHLDKDGKILAKKASFLWMVFDDSREILNFVKFQENLRITDSKIAKFWIKEFTEKPIEELYDYGINVISSAYGIVVDYFREYVMMQKYERIYSKSNDFDEWFELADKNRTLMEGQEIPFDIQKISEKAKTIIAVRN